MAFSLWLASTRRGATVRHSTRLTTLSSMPGWAALPSQVTRIVAYSKPAARTKMLGWARGRQSQKLVQSLTLRSASSTHSISTGIASTLATMRCMATGKPSFTRCSPSDSAFAASSAQIAQPLSALPRLRPRGSCLGYAQSYSSTMVGSTLTTLRLLLYKRPCQSTQRSPLAPSESSISSKEAHWSETTTSTAR